MTVSVGSLKCDSVAEKCQKCLTLEGWMACKYLGSLLFEKVFADRDCLQLWCVCASYGVLLLSS